MCPAVCPDAGTCPVVHASPQRAASYTYGPRRILAPVLPDSREVPFTIDVSFPLSLAAERQRTVCELRAVLGGADADAWLAFALLFLKWRAKRSEGQYEDRCALWGGFPCTPVDPR